ncbi:Mbeg1-like protein [Actinobacillus equuli]|uniref:Mbeg1-like protein n=1 Tax=Actinobacillus equuli TaxID=718 RepID=UPI0024420A49|nr:Mbeg1-like protein [Actinobacillus equuli]WGE59207.1 DUF2974 domain-containing protein [Actinobacillus equuli subsp. haemolyticus]WGE62152.1 DUF2974 domain-containing protein [Actinobacillus equuli subsp. haemolyticus]
MSSSTNDLKEYVAKNQTKLFQNVTNSYKTDSDKDGIIDINDKDPNMWNVSDRDLRIFSALAYESKSKLDAYFKLKPTVIDSSYAQQIKEVVNNWEVLRTESPGSGLDYTIFGNGKNADGSYNNVVIAFRGTTDLPDLTADLRLAFGDTPMQTAYLDQAAKYIEEYKPKNVYSTGHSLGGYLAEYFVAHTIQSRADWADTFKRSALFNPAILKHHDLSSQTLKKAADLANEFTKTNVTDDSDKSNIVTKHKTDSYVISGEFVDKFLGHYDGTTFFDFKKGQLSGLHALSSFFEKNNQLKEEFSQGYRMDHHYDNDDSDNDGLTDIMEKRIGSNIHKADTDNDGYDDSTEAYLGSDALASNIIPTLTDNGIQIVVLNANGNSVAYGIHAEQPIALMAESHEVEAVAPMALESELTESSLLVAELEQPLEAETLSLPSEFSVNDDSLEEVSLAANDGEFSYPEAANFSGFATNLEAPQYEAAVI